MSVAYVILAHRAPDQVARLVARLRAPGSRVVLHVDRSADLEPFRAVLAPAVADGQLEFARRRLRSRWGSFALVDATLHAVEQAMQGSTFSHVCLLSGDSYPLAPAATVQAFLESAGGRSFIFHSPGDGVSRPDRTGNRVWYWNGDLRRVTFRHYQLGDRQPHLPNRFVPRFPRLAPPSDLRFFQGSQWWALSRGAAREVVEAFIRRPELRRYFRRVQAPDEWAFQMVLCNSPLATTLVDDDLHFIQWRDWHAQTLGQADLPALRDAPKLFARKLDLAADPELGTALDDLIAERSQDGGAFLQTLHAHHLGG